MLLTLRATVALQGSGVVQLEDLLIHCLLFSREHVPW